MARSKIFPLLCVHLSTENVQIENDIGEELKEKNVKRNVLISDPLLKEAIPY